MVLLAESEHFVHIFALLFVFLLFLRLFFIVSSNNELYFKTFRDLLTFGNYVIFTTFNELPTIDILYTYSDIKASLYV